ncbi:lysine--tRNA ligase [Candidatus Uhrbacteria bacterium]|nr:lysine--tRNA ligase [Candidatus Uhrbacteria bacterium]
MMDEREVRLGKLEALRAAGHEPYAVDARRDTTCGQVLASFEAWMEAGKSVTLDGRVMSIRVHGGMMFADLEDESGRIQLLFKEDDIAEAFALFRDAIDPADFVEATGVPFLTKRGEKSLKVSSWRILVKAILPLPEKWHGLQDVETRFRQRELDLLSNPEVRERFRVRSKLVSSLRSFLDERGFLEVETPMLQPIPGGANARPFVTHHNALDVDLYLRIAPELYLKRLVVGGFEKVYEVGRCFRNEGIDPTHNPEFTMMELYWAYANKEEFLTMIEDMLSHMVKTALGKEFGAPFPRLTFREAILNETGIDIDDLKNEKDVIAAVKKAKVKVDFKGSVGLGEYLDELYKKTARAKLSGPVWVLDYPIEMKPLANRVPGSPNKSATAQLVVQGAEIVNAYYHELHDPIDQRNRFEEQQALAEKGSEEAQRMDTGFLEALEHGLPPTSGFGMGIDRLTAILTEAPSLKEVILFPTLRPKTD